MQSLLDILGNKDFDTPPEISIIKDFVRKNFHQAECEVTMHNTSITVTVRSAALAGALRSKLHILQKELPGKHKVYIKIG